MKQWTRVTPGWNFLSSFYLLGMLSYGLGLTLYALTLRSKNIAIATVILVLFNIITLLCVGYLFFDEKYTWVEISGVTLGALAILLLEL